MGLTFKDFNEKYKVAIPRVEAFCRYKAPASFGDILTVTLQLDEKTEKTMKYSFEIQDLAAGCSAQGISRSSVLI